jgi:hypothetical protein
MNSLPDLIMPRNKFSTGDYVVLKSSGTASDKGKAEGQVMATWDNMSRVKWTKDDGRIEMWIEPVENLRKKK